MLKPGLLFLAFLPAFFCGRPAEWDTRARPFLRPDQMVFAHRGASAQAPENTLEAFALAVQQKADVLELDVRLSRDHQAVVLHDATLLRTHQINQKARDLSAKDMARLNIPDLYTVLHRFRTRTNIELKDQDLELAESTFAAIQKARAADRVLVGSFHRTSIEHFRHISGGAIATGASGTEVIEFYLHCQTGWQPSFAVAQAVAKTSVLKTLPFEALQLPVRAFFMDLSQADFLRCARRSGLAVHFWTIDDPAEMERLWQVGADGIMTNYPARAVEARELNSSR